MDTSAGKATTEEQKKKFHAEGQCYECEHQGHMARDCPTKKLKARSAEITKVLEEVATPEQLLYSVQEMIARATKFSNKEQSAFIQGLCEEDEDEKTLGFPQA